MTSGALLVGLDGSERERGVLAEAIDLAGRLDRRLILYRAVALPPALPERALMVSPDEVGPILLEDARAQLERLRPLVPVERFAKVRVDLGTPWRSLVDAANDEKASMIVIGAHGHSGVERLLGTTAAKVVNHAACSVLVVRSDERR
jgi:nucleotide-binding universal stress UspA family protein